MVWTSEKGQPSNENHEMEACRSIMAAVEHSENAALAGRTDTGATHERSFLQLAYFNEGGQISHLTDGMAGMKLYVCIQNDPTQSRINTIHTYIQRTSTQPQARMTKTIML